MLRKFFLLFVPLILVFVSTAQAASGGIALGATRLIYDKTKKQASMPVINSSESDRFLINSWIEDSDTKKVTDVLVTPPIFISEPKTRNVVSIINTNKTLPDDRESLYYLNVQAIPSIDKKLMEDENNVLQLAILTRIKMMVRPPKLPIPVEQAPDLLEASLSNQKIIFKNPTPYFMTVVNLKLDNQTENKPPFMITPYSDHELDYTAKSLTFQTINDYGAFTPEKKVNF